MILIGIDPGVDKCGVTAINEEFKQADFASFAIWDVFNYLLSVSKNYQYLSVIENSNLLKGNWHGKSARGNVGKNKAVSKIIVDYCKAHELRYIEIKPNGYSIQAKNKAVFEAICKADGVTFPSRSNEHERAAYLIAQAGRKQWVLSRKKRVNQ